MSGRRRRNQSSRRKRSFSTRYDITPTTVEDPVVIESNRAYIEAAADAVVTVTVGEISLDGGSTWVTSGVRGTFKYLLMRGESSTDYSTAVINSATIGGVEYNFVIWTKADPATLVDYWENLSGENILDVSGDPIEVIQT